jgi:hypothetical protein
VRALLMLGVLASCAPRVHAEIFVKRNFGFAGSREITLVGPSSDTNALRLKLQKLGFTVLEVDHLGEAKTAYAADIAGVCNWRLLTDYGEDMELHVFVVKTETRERVFSARLDNNSDCPDAFFVETANAIARNWPPEQ